MNKQRDSHMEFSKEAQSAMYKMIHQTPGIDPKQIADVLGDSHKTVLNYANPNMDQHLPTVKAIESMMTFTRNPALVKAWAHKLGLMCVPANQAEEKEHQVSVLERLLQININNGHVNQHIADVMADGVVTPSELADTVQILEEMEANLRGLRVALEKEAGKYLSALKREKA